MTKQFGERFFEWQNYVHYALLAGFIVLLAYIYSVPLNWDVYLILFMGLLIGDTVVHALFWYAPKGLRWRD